MEMVILKRTLLMLLFFMFSISSEIFAQPTSFEKGKVIDSISVGQTSETYALYLPEKFDPNQLSAAVFIFDPSGSGKGGLRPFIESAEKFNYILICSNNSKNGLFDTNFPIINRLFDEIFKTFSIDEKQIYTAGFSGGSRLATAVASLSGQIQGVIACGAGFSPNTTHTPSPGASFSYVGLVGNEDMNYQEMHGATSWLDAFEIPNELFVNNDNHKWPPSNQIVKAFGWLELQAYKKGIRTRDNTFVINSYRRIYEEAKGFEDSGQMDLSVREYERLMRNFTPYYQLDSISDKLKTLKKSKDYRRELKNQEFIKEEEQKLRSTFVERFIMEIDAKNPPNNYKWWSKELKKLDERYIKSKDSAFQKMGQRIGYAVYAMAIETGNSHRRDGFLNKAVYAHKLVTVVLPNQAWPYYLLATDYAKMKNQAKTFENLQIAISKGFKAKQYILNTKEFIPYLEHPQFVETLEAIENK